VCRNAKNPKQKIDAVVAFFQDNFTYGLEEMDLPRGAEPLSHFLLHRPPAHCEFFASGAVTLLRFEGVPCRYVTGYVVAELEDEYGDYWLARNQNAHAWAEAYDDQRQRWFLVEATPGMSVPRETDRETDSLAQSGAVASRDTATLVDPMRWLDGRWLGRRWESISAWATSPVFALVIGSILTSVVYWARRRGRSPEGAVNRRLAQMRRVRAKVDRRLSRRRFTRRQHETLHQFARRLRQASREDEGLCGYADWYVEYASELYGGDTSMRGRAGGRFGKIRTS
jgi:hypothetical protein